MKKKNVLLLFPVLMVLAYFVVLLMAKNSFNTQKIQDRINRVLAEQIEEYNKHYLFQKKDIKFSIRNSIDLIVFPKIKININDLDIKSVQYKTVIVNMNIKRIEISLGFFDFFKRKLTPKKILVSGIDVMVENNELPDSYVTKEIKKRIVKLDDNEVYGVRDKLKNILTASNNNKQDIQEGYKEIEIEEETVYNLDNSKVKFILIDLLKQLKVGELNMNKIPDILFSKAILSIIDNGNIQKEFKNISGKLEIDGDGDYKLNTDFILNNINGNLRIESKKHDNDYSVNCELKNELSDNVTLQYVGEDILINDFDKIKTGMTLNVKASNFNNLVQWIFSVNSKYYNMFNYKKSFNLSTEINKNGREYKIKNMTISSEDVDLIGNIELMEKENNINVVVNNLNLDEFIVSVSKEKNTTTDDDIHIFKTASLGELMDNLKISKSEQGVKNTKFSIIFKTLIKQYKTISDSSIDFEIVNNNYKINSLIINIDNIKITAEAPEIKDNLYYNKLNVVGDDLSSLTKAVNLSFFKDIKEFKISSNIIVFNNIIYLMDFRLTDRNETKENTNTVDGDIEYSFNRNKKYMALNINLDNLSVNFDNEQTKTLKEKFLGLNNLTSSNNVFLNIKVNNFSYNDTKNISFDLKTNYQSGFINFYDIKEINLDKFKNIKGNVLFDIRSKNPIFNVNLYIEEASYDLDLANYVFDIEKYKQLLLREEINKEIQDKYWINKLFSISTWEEINGKINLQIQKFNFNNSVLNNINFDSTIDNGTINMNNLTFVGLGGSTELKGKIDLKTSRNIHLVLTDTTYNISDIVGLFVKDEQNDIITGPIGIGGIIQATGFNREIFAASLSMKFRFVSNNLFIKKLGLEKLRDDLKNIYNDDKLLKELDVKKSILDDSGTTFTDVNGSLSIANRVSNFSVDAKTDYISSKLVSKIDNTGKNMVIDMINTSIIMNKIGKSSIPLYSIITFKEDFANKANLIINTSQIEEYVNKIKKTKGIN
ncbi:MAG: hypothetical protein IJ853_01595 [Rickettsiales bacterium]|nr:hypothetical protein [Rickettsiales bacterium]